MSSASIKKIIPCKKNQLIEMVLDIEKYPEFVPWCIEGKLYNKNDIQKIAFSEKKTENKLTQKSFIQTFLSSVKQKMYGNSGK